MTATVHENMPFDRYCLDLEGESSTGLRKLIRSPLEYKWWKEHDQPDRDELRVGRAAHTAILEPHLFAEGYAVWPPGSRVTATGRTPPRSGKEWDAFKFEHEAAGKTILTREQHQNAIEIARAARAHKVAGRILAEAGRAELSISWVHERTGIAMKARLDWLCSSLNDIKTARDIEPRLFSGSSARFGYHTQSSIYKGALMALGMDAPAKLIVIQSGAPFDVAVFAVSDQALMVGEQAYEAALDTLAVCRARGEWPGIASDGELDLHLPNWAVPDYDDDAEWSVTAEAV